MKTRVLFVSDMHYTTQEKYEEIIKTFPNAIPSEAAGTVLGVTQGEKIERIYSDIMAEHRKEPLDAVLILGDLSLDDYSFRNLPECYCQKFKTELMDRLPCPAYAIPGNHDSITEEMWREIFGYGRQHSVKIGDCVFIMLDTFATVPSRGASGGIYSGIDEDFLRSEVSKYPEDSKLFICAHYLGKEETLPFEIPSLVCLFQGHTHSARALDFHGRYLFDIGGYGYNGVVNKKGDYTFNRFFEDCAWGYNVLESFEGGVRVWHKRVKMRYLAENGEFDIPERDSDLIEISVK